jgi:hypothetical protein
MTAHTERDLLITARHVTTLEHFLLQQRKLFAETCWPSGQKEQGEQLLHQFEEALKQARERYADIWQELHEGAPLQPPGTHLEGRRF